MGYYYDPIKSDDPQAVEKLTQRLDTCQKYQKMMKDRNAYYRKNGTMVGCPDISIVEAKSIDRKIGYGYSSNKKPYPSYMLKRNNQQIYRLKKRIEQLIKNKKEDYFGYSNQ